jgi:hypothetical protein
VVVAVPAVRVMQVPGYQVIGVIGVGDDLVPAPRLVGVGLVVSTAGVRRRAALRVRPFRGQSTFVDMIAV